MNKLRLLLIIMLTVTIIASFQISVKGEKSYQEELPDDGMYFNCKYCHISKSSGGPLNQFGKDFESNNFTYNDVLDAMDSDGDGYTNYEEFNSKPVTNPGDSDSYPSYQINFLVVLLVLGVISAIVIGIFYIWKR